MTKETNTIGARIRECRKALHTTPNYLLMGETEEDPWMEDVMQVLSEIKDPAMRKLAIDQLKCIARIS